MSNEVKDPKQTLVEVGKCLLSFVDQLEESNKKTRNQINDTAKEIFKRLKKLEQRMDRLDSRLNSMEDINRNVSKTTSKKL